jgi:hypothetical protein
MYMNSFFPGVGNLWSLTRGCGRGRPSRLMRRRGERERDEPDAGIDSLDPDRFAEPTPLFVTFVAKSHLRKTVIVGDSRVEG